MIVLMKAMFPIDANNVRDILSVCIIERHFTATEVE